MNQDEVEWDDNVPVAEPPKIPDFRHRRHEKGPENQTACNADQAPPIENGNNHQDSSKKPQAKQVSVDEQESHESWQNTNHQPKSKVQENVSLPNDRAKTSDKQNTKEQEHQTKYQTKQAPKQKADPVSYDNFVKDLPAQKKQQAQKMDMSKWDASLSMEENKDGAFKKKKNQNQPILAEQNQEQFPVRGNGRGDGGFRRKFEEDNAQGGGQPAQGQGQGQGGFGGFGGRGRGNFGDREGGGGYGGGRGGGFGDSGGRGGGFGDSGGRGGGGFGGGRGGGFGGDRGGFGGDRDGGFGGRGGGRGGRGGGFGGRGGRGGGGYGGYGGGEGRRQFNDGGFGRRDFGDSGNNACFGRRNYNDQDGNSGNVRNFESQKPKPQNILETQPEVKQQFNPAQLSVIDSLQKQQTEKLKISPEFRINTTMATQPLGLKCWPTVSIYVKKSKVSLYLSRIHDHNCSILYFPYSNYTMNLYPGNMINQFPFDYRKKLKEKNKPAGQAYLQRCVGMKNFNILAFAMINEEDKNSTAQSLKSMFDQADRTQKQTIESALIPYSPPLGSLKPILQCVFAALDKSEKFKQIIISAKDPQIFCKAASEFLEVIQELADNNDLVIQ